MFSIRRGVFETNSSSTHSMTMCLQSDYDKWERGEVLYDKYNSKFVPVEEAETYKITNKYSKLVTENEFWNDGRFEGFSDTFTTPNGETIVAFGEYGYDG